MGKDLYDEFPVSRQVFEEVDESLGLGLSRLMFGGDPKELTLTKNAQPAIVAVSVATVRALEHESGMPVSDIYSCTMGHSVGEYSALIAARAVSLADGIRLVRTRGESMQDAIREREYAMSACILRRTKVEDVVEEVNRIQQEVAKEAADQGHSAEDEVVQVANINSSSQIVLSGTKVAVERALASLQSKRMAMRAVNLPVSAPFHCRLMAPAREVLAARIKDLSPIAEPSTWEMPVISNVTARPHESAEDMERLLAEQVDSPVLWLQSMEYLKNEHGISRWGAIGPGNVVGNLAGKEYAKDIVRRLSDAAAIRDFVAVLSRQESRGF
ncbi:FabD/lysophospholipase-like protein [Martensiomyces pterosporus]|nr:FabD/lysophospholipase-like protein [Martensiomyces pterosporus]